MEQVAEGGIVMELIFVPLNLQMKTWVIVASLSANRVNTNEQQVPFITEGKNYCPQPVTQAISRVDLAGRRRLGIQCQRGSATCFCRPASAVENDSCHLASTYCVPGPVLNTTRVISAVPPAVL